MDPSRVRRSIEERGSGCCTSQHDHIFGRTIVTRGLERAASTLGDCWPGFVAGKAAAVAGQRGGNDSGADKEAESPAVVVRGPGGARGFPQKVEPRQR